MKLIVQETQPVLFATSEVLENVEFLPGIWKAGVLIVETSPTEHRLITISQARREGLAILQATQQELDRLIGAGYSIAAAIGFSLQKEPKK